MNSLPRLLSWIVVVAFWQVPAGAETVREARKKAASAGITLLEAGEYDAAFSAYGPTANHLMCTALFRKADDAHKAEDTDAAKRYLELYFKYAPFTFTERRWSSVNRDWCKAAFKYVDLKRESLNESARRGDPDIAVRPLYQELISYEFRAGTYEDTKKLADEIVRNYPKSIFAPAAVLAVADGSATWKFNGAPSAKVYDHFLELMEQSGVPARSLIPVLIFRAEVPLRSLRKGELQAHYRQILAAYQRIDQLTDIPYGKRFCLFHSAEIAACMHDRASTKLSRKLYRRFMTDFPNVYETRIARSGLIHTYLSAGELKGAHAALREIAGNAPPKTDLSRYYLDVGKAYLETEEYKKAMTICQTLIKEYPQGYAWPGAYLAMGKAYEGMGDERRMVRAYIQAAGVGTSGTRKKFLYASFAREDAIQLLGNYYMEEEDWAEALKYWKAWSPLNFCGSGAAQDRRQKASKIKACLAGIPGIPGTPTAIGGPKEKKTDAPEGRE